MYELPEVGKFAVAIFSIINPIGAVPIFLSMTSDLTDYQRKKMSKACSLAVLSTLVLSFLVGNHILQIFGISIASFTIAGGFLVFTMSMSMIKAKSSETKLNAHEVNDSKVTEIGIVPLAIPLLSGPGSISTTIIYADKLNTPLEWGLTILTFVAGSLLIYFVFSRASKIQDKIGELGMNVLTRIMGLILLAMSIEMVLGGVKDIMPILKSNL